MNLETNALKLVSQIIRKDAVAFYKRDDGGVRIAALRRAFYAHAGGGGFIGIQVSRKFSQFVLETFKVKSGIWRRFLNPGLNLLFQLAGLILLVAMIGAIVLTLRHRSDVKRQNVLAQMYRDPAKAMELKDVKPGQGL